MKIREEETQSFFGFIVPVRQAMWVELLVIQVTIFVTFSTEIIIIVAVVIILKYVLSLIAQLPGCGAQLLLPRPPRRHLGRNPLHQGSSKSLSFKDL